MNQQIFSDTKKHYQILDGLRGVAAIIVLLFHIFEIFSNGDHTKLIINHGYLAVDFFFLLSGFVIAHAYDDRWHKMTFSQFFKRRLIRLHPMIIMGMTIGAICFYFGNTPSLFPNIEHTSIWMFSLVLLLGYLLIPIPTSMDIRGWEEMYPINPPAWSLFYEYVANILYALFLKKTSTRVLIVFVIITGFALAYYTITNPNGDIIGGWSITSFHIQIGFTRLLYPFLMGLLLSRLFKPMTIKNGFLWCNMLIILFMAMPRVGGTAYLWMNGIYDSAVIIIIFPVIVFIGASGTITGKISSKICTFLGDISYPLYIIHLPIVYIFYAWIIEHKLSLVEAFPMGMVVFVVSIVLAYLCFKLYDIPVRKWLTKKYMTKTN